MYLTLTLTLACSMAGKWDSPAGGDPTLDTAEGDSGGVLGPALLITELMKDPDAVDDDLGEWFEVTNVGAGSASLATLEVQDDEGDGFVVEAWTLAPGATVVFGASADTELNGGAPVDIAYDVDRFKLGNDGGTITLRLGGMVIDAVVYDGSFPDEKGAAISLSPVVLTPEDNDVATAWCAASTPFGGGDRGTPGAANDTCDGDPPDLDHDDDGIADADDCAPEDADVHPGASEVDNGVDDNCDGHLDERPPERGELIVTEMLNDPDPTDDDVGEWFEVLNVGDVALMLDGLAVTDAGGTGFTVLSTTILDPAEIWVLGVSADEAVNGGYRPDYLYASEDLRLHNEEDELTLSLNGVLIDTVSYDLDFPHEKGKSQSLDPGARSASSNDDPDNWCEGDGEYGTDGNQGTPGEPNPACP